MKLSLMLLNLEFPVFMNPDFSPKTNPNVEDYEAVFKLAADAGYKAVDLATMEFKSFGADVIKGCLDKYNLKCASVIMFDDFAVTDAQRRTEVIARGKQIIDDLVKIDCHVLMLVIDGRYANGDRQTMQQAMVENLKEICAYAVERQVCPCVEDFPSTQVPMCATKDLDYLLAHVPGLKLVYDNGNMLVEGEDPKEYFEHFKERIGYYHVKEVWIADEKRAMELGGGRPVGDKMADGRYMVPTLHGKGILDLKGLMGLMKREHYIGHMSVEYAPGPTDSKNHLENVIAARVLLENYIIEG